MTDDERRAEIAWTQQHHFPHGCGDNGEGAGCDQELDGTCDRATCAYRGLTGARASTE